MAFRFYQYIDQYTVDFNAREDEVINSNFSSMNFLKLFLKAHKHFMPEIITQLYQQYVTRISELILLKKRKQ